MTEEYCEDCKGIEIESWVDGQLVIETGSKLCQYHAMIDELITAMKSALEDLKYIHDEAGEIYVVGDAIDKIEAGLAKVKG